MLPRVLPIHAKVSTLQLFTNCLSVDAGKGEISADPPLQDHMATPTSLALPDLKSQASRLLAPPGFLESPNVSR